MTVTLADVDAGVRRAIAAYTHALDDGRVDDLVATFCPDGGIDMDGLGTHEGHAALRAAYESVRPQAPQRHLALNTHIVRWDDHEAEATSDVVFLLPGERGWSAVLVGRYHDVLHHDAGTWRFHRRQARFVHAG